MSALVFDSTLICPASAAGIGAEILAQPLGLPQDGARVLQQRAPGLGRLHALPAAHQQSGAERLLHVADAGRGRRQREVGALGAVGDAAGVDDVAEQAQVGEIEAHGPACATFEFDEGRLRQILIVNQLLRATSFVNDEATGLPDLPGRLRACRRWYATDNCRRQIAGHPRIR